MRARATNANTNPGISSASLPSLPLISERERSRSRQRCEPLWAGAQSTRTYACGVHLELPARPTLIGNVIHGGGAAPAVG